MVEAVKGFMTADGQFFESKEEAEHHEVGKMLIRACDKNLKVTKTNTMNFIRFIDEELDLVTNYCNALRNLRADKEARPANDELEEMKRGTTYGKDKEQSTSKKENGVNVDQRGSGRNSSDEDDSEMSDV